MSQRKENHVLAVTRNDDEVFVHADLVGIDLLINRLTRIRDAVAQGRCEHDHLMTASWGDGALTESIGAEPEDAVIVHHLKVCGWTEE